MSSTDFDVIVIGGGPAGLATAIRAAMAGFSAAVFERREPPINNACGEGLLPSGVSLLHHDLGIDVGALESFEIKGVRFIDRESSAEADFDSGFALGLRRRVLHRELVRRADRLGVDLRWGEKVVDVRGTGIVSDAGFSTSRWIVAADGRNSLVRSWVGADGRSPRSQRYGVRRHFRIRPWSDRVEVYWSDVCEAYVTPVADDEINVALLAEDVRSGFDGLVNWIPALRRRLEGVTASGRARGAGPFGGKARWAASRNLAFVGDAAVSIDGISGEGVSLAFADAVAAVEAMRRGSWRSYTEHHRRSRRSIALTTALLLAQTRRPKMRERVMRELAGKPELLRTFVGEHRPGGRLLPVARAVASLVPAALRAV